jgi:hypothetical protein
MDNDPPPTSTAECQPSHDGWPVFAVWKKYQDIAMHFNDLLIRLRTQALAAVGTVATIIGILARRGENQHVSWEMIAYAFAFLVFFWIAVWVLDFCYYNRLLSGAVAALLQLESLSKESLYVRHINMSTKIEDSVAADLPKNPMSSHLNLGRWLFYVIVMLVLVVALVVSLYYTVHN